MKVITCANFKGGTGKSTVIFNLGGYLISKGKKVLFLDMDMQANISENFGLNEVKVAKKGGKYKTNMDILMKDASPEEVILQIPLRDKTIIDIVPSTFALAAADSDIILLNDNRKNYFLLKNWIEKNKEYLSRYDFILCDVGPYLSPSTINALFASDDIYLVMSPGTNPHKGVYQMYKLWDMNTKIMETSNNIRGVIVNRYNSRYTSVTEAFKEFLFDEENTPTSLKIFNSFIHESASIFKGELKKTPITLSKDREVLNSPGYKSFIRLMNELEEEGLI